MHRRFEEKTLFIRKRGTIKEYNIFKAKKQVLYQHRHPHASATSSAFVYWWNRAHRRVPESNTNKSIIKVTKTEVRRTVLFVWREVGGTHTGEGEAVLARPASLPLRGALCGRTLDRHPRAAGTPSPKASVCALTGTNHPGLYTRTLSSSAVYTRGVDELY
ncbi:unnamed protein product, partial [Iphiclides podalirius]